MFLVTVLKAQTFFSMNFLEILDITKNSFLRCELLYFALANIRLHRNDSFSRFILLLLGDINVNPGPTTVNNNKIYLNTLSFYNCHEPTAPSECNSFADNKEHDNSKWNIFKKGSFIFYI